MSEKTILPFDAVRRRLLLRGTVKTAAYFDDKRSAAARSIKRRQNTSLRHRAELGSPTR